ncbi:hypothetical protein N431DRAFT_232795 [Stipitochalara longipes BDJ]|nr:hypothetical protein N431DRAFT_232795 [Stipitochalara longipes BDJ]
MAPRQATRDVRKVGRQRSQDEMAQLHSRTSARLQERTVSKGTNTESKHSVLSTTRNTPGKEAEKRKRKRKRSQEDEAPYPSPSQKRLRTSPPLEDTTSENKSAGF